MVTVFERWPNGRNPQFQTKFALGTVVRAVYDGDDAWSSHTAKLLELTVRYDWRYRPRHPDCYMIGFDGAIRPDWRVVPQEPIVTYHAFGDYPQMYGARRMTHHVNDVPLTRYGVTECSDGAYGVRNIRGIMGTGTGGWSPVVGYVDGEYCNPGQRYLGMDTGRMSMSVMAYESGENLGGSSMGATMNTYDDKGNLLLSGGAYRPFFTSVVWDPGYPDGPDVRSRYMDRVIAWVKEVNGPFDRWWDHSPIRTVMGVTTLLYQEKVHTQLRAFDLSRPAPLRPVSPVAGGGDLQTAPGEGGGLFVDRIR